MVLQRTYFMKNTYVSNKLFLVFSNLQLKNKYDITFMYYRVFHNDGSPEKIFSKYIQQNGKCHLVKNSILRSVMLYLL